MGLHWVANKLARNGSAQRFVAPEPFLGVSRQNIRRKLIRWMVKQHLDFCRGPRNTQRQARELITDPDMATGARVLSFNRTQTKVVIGLLTGHNTLRGHLCIIVLGNNPICWRFGTEEETSVHVLCECEALVSLRHLPGFFFFLDTEDIKILGVGAILSFGKGTRLL